MRLGTLLLFALAASPAWSAPQSEQTVGGDSQGQQQDAKADAKHQKDVENDKKLGADFSKQIEKEVEFSKNEEYKARVTRIGDEVAAIANKSQVRVLWGDPKLSSFDYHFFVLKGDDVNAFSVPGGYIYVYEGLVQFAESDDELAGVLAHEISHAAFRHIATMQKEQSKLDLLSIGAILAAIWSQKDAGKILVPTGLAIQGVQSGWSVKAEEAADFGGLQFMLKSKYNPLAMLTFMERLAYRDRFMPNTDWGIFQTHPPTDERARTLVGELQKCNVPFHRSTVTTSLRAANKIGDGGIEVWFGQTKIHVFSGDDAQTRADRAVDHLNEFFDAVPAMYELQKDGTTVVGANRRLFDVEQQDAEAEGSTLKDSVDKAIQSLKKAIFDLGYRVWASKIG